MTEKAGRAGLLFAVLLAVAPAASSACGGSEVSSSSGPTATADASTSDVARSPGDGAATLPPLALPPDPAAPDCNRQDYSAITTYVPDFDARRASSDSQTRVGLVNQVADLIPLADAVRWLRDLAGCEADAKVRGGAIAALVNRGERVLAQHLPLGVGDPNELWPQPDLVAARTQAAGQGAPAGWAALHLSIFGDATDVGLFANLTKDENVFARFSAALGFVSVGEVATGGAVLDSIARSPNAPGNHFYIERSLLVLRALGDQGALADLVAFLDEIDESAEPNDVSHVQVILRLLAIVAGEARPDAAAWRAWLESTGQPSVGTRR